MDINESRLVFMCAQWLKCPQLGGIVGNEDDLTISAYGVGARELEVEID